MEEIIEGCFKLFFAIFFIIGIPVLMLYGAWLAFVWVMNELNKFWALYGVYVWGTIVALAATFLISFAVAVWWQTYRIKIIRRRALKRLDALYEQTAKKIDELSTTPGGAS